MVIWNVFQLLSVAFLVPIQLYFQVIVKFVSLLFFSSPHVAIFACSQKDYPNELAFFNAY